ncbi:hypothetical protein B0H13DRAFT_1915420 [Mycena leptocephala]|nr:hypothetical protein B0H13DRAFT_1915420 [Mycena leptocephala]
MHRESHRMYGLRSYVRCTYREPFWRVPWNPYIYGYESVSSRTSANALELCRGAPSQFGFGSDHLLGVSFSDINHAAAPHLMICPPNVAVPGTVPYTVYGSLSVFTYLITYRIQTSRSARTAATCWNTDEDISKNLRLWEGIFGLWLGVFGRLGLLVNILRLWKEIWKEFSPVECKGAANLSCTLKSPSVHSDSELVESYKSFKLRLVMIILMQAHGAIFSFDGIKFESGWVFSLSSLEKVKIHESPVKNLTARIWCIF